MLSGHENDKMRPAKFCAQLHYVLRVAQSLVYQDNPTHPVGPQQKDTKLYQKRAKQIYLINTLVTTLHLS